MSELTIISFAPGTAEARHHVIRLSNDNETEAIQHKCVMATLGVPLKTFSTYSDAEEYVTNNS